MPHTFLPIREAAKRYEASEITLRRLVREVVKDPKHEYRSFVRPSAADFAAFQKSNKSFEYEISTQLLDLRYGQIDAAKTADDALVADAQADIGSAAMSVLRSTNDLLRDQLHVKDDQIRQLHESLRAMQQQQNATNVLLVRLSERIPLLSEPSPVRADVAEAKTDDGPEAGSKSEGKATKKKAETKRGGGVFGRWFRWGER